MLLASAAARLSAATRQLAAASPLHGVFGMFARGMKGKVLRKPMWDGWPRYSPDGWPYARFMKKSRGKDYISKQAWRRLHGKEKHGARSPNELHRKNARQLNAPAFFLRARAQVIWRVHCKRKCWRRPSTRAECMCVVLPVYFVKPVI